MIIKALPNEEYHTRPEISKSGLDRIAISPLFFKEGEYTESASMSLGTLIHTVILEHHEFNCRYVVGPDADKNTKSWKNFVNEIGPGLIPLKPCEYDKAMFIRNSVFRHPKAKELLDLAGRSEISVINELNGIPVRCRPDRLTDNGICIDLKTTRSVQTRSISKSMHDYRYHVQNAFYFDVLRAEGIDIEGFVFIFVETSPPYDVNVCMLTDDAIELGRNLYKRDIETYKQCLESDKWPGVSDTVTEIDLPRYAYYEGNV